MKPHKILILFSLVAFLLAPLFLATACGSGGDSSSTDQGGGDETGDGDGDGTGDGDGDGDGTGDGGSQPSSSLSVANMSLRADQATVSIDNGSLTLSGNAGAITTASGESIGDCSTGSAQLVVNGSTLGTASNLNADCSFQVTVNAISGDKIELRIADASTSSPYVFTAPSSTGSLQAAVLSGSQLISFPGLAAGQNYPLCKVDTGQSDCVDATSDCLIVTSDSNGEATVLLEKGSTYQLLIEGGNPACLTEQVLTDDEATAVLAEADQAAADSAAAVQADLDTQAIYDKFKGQPSAKVSAASTSGEIEIGVTFRIQGSVADTQEKLAPVSECMNGSATECQDVGTRIFARALATWDQAISVPTQFPLRINETESKYELSAVNHDDGLGCYVNQSTVTSTPKVASLTFEAVVTETISSQFLTNFGSILGFQTVYDVTIYPYGDTPQWTGFGDLICSSQTLRQVDDAPAQALEKLKSTSYTSQSGTYPSYVYKVVMDGNIGITNQTSPISVSDYGQWGILRAMRSATIDITAQ